MRIRMSEGLSTVWRNAPEGFRPGIGVVFIPELTAEQQIELHRRIFSEANDWGEMPSVNNVKLYFPIWVTGEFRKHIKMAGSPDVYEHLFEVCNASDNNWTANNRAREASYVNGGEVTKTAFCELLAGARDCVEGHNPVRFGCWGNDLRYDLFYVTVVNDGNIEIEPMRDVAVDRPVIQPVNDGGESRQKIIFGAPGTGKSYSLKTAYEGENAHFRDRWERVTFYPTYSYSQFVGTYKPVMKVVGDEEKISYQFVPGPFLRSLVKAANDPDHNYLLIVEEINRANAAAVFGDVFQILDRGDDGESEYSIGASEDVIRYLQGTVGLGEPVLSPEAKRFFGMTNADDEPTGDCALKLPKNFYIWATMNSADQGVFPLDTAFKRRWEFEYLRLDAGENADDCAAWMLAGRRGYHWNEVRKLINSVLSAQGVNEDKLMGPFFVKAARDNEGNHLPISQQAFESKVLMYLWEDAARMCRRQIFGDVKTYSQLLNKWEDDGLAIFTPALERDERLRRDYGNLVYPPAQNPEPNAQ